MNLHGSITLLLLTTVFLTPSRAVAWGERGHDLVTRVAVRTLVQRAEADPALAALLLGKEHMLGHLANVPDIVWRNVDRETEAINGPTHYFDLEYVVTKPTFASLPQSTGEQARMILELCEKADPGFPCPVQDHAKIQASLAGSAPFRVRQLFHAMRHGFEKAKIAEKPTDRGGKDYTAAVNEALLHAGLLSHFVGDLANPYHTTRDYDGYEQGQGGVHKYFESDVVDALDLDLDAEVLKAAVQSKPFARLGQQLPAGSPSTLGQDPLAIAYALTLDSHQRLAKVNQLDRKEALLKPSSHAHGVKVKAERRPAAAVAARFRPMIVERLALAADTLATLWILAWEQAGRPNLGKFQSYEYPVAPAFIKPEYPDEVARPKK